MRPTSARAAQKKNVIPRRAKGGLSGCRLTRHKVSAVCTSCQRLMLDSATSLRCALDDAGWGGLCFALPFHPSVSWALPARNVTDQRFNTVKRKTSFRAERSEVAESITDG